MFTGIIESLGEVVKCEKEGSNIIFSIKSELTPELKIDQSVAHNGVCLTVIDLREDIYRVTAIEETLRLTNLKELVVGSFVNLERCLKLNDRLDGHIVQGHVDTTATVKSIENKDGSWIFTFNYTANETVLVKKGSITINGVSLTLVSCSDTEFSVAIIPYTYANTVFQYLQVNHKVNIEFDVIGKYVAQLYLRQR